MDSQSSVSAFGEGQGDSSVIKETEAAQLEEMQSDDFLTLRMKKLVASVLAEFKTVNHHFTLNDEEAQ